MPSFGTHNRNYSWPPSLHHVAHLPRITQTYNHGLLQQPELKAERHNRPSTDVDDDIDNDPFSHFISPESEIDDPLAAGITSTESISSRHNRFVATLARRWARSVPSRHGPHPRGRHNRRHTAAADYNIEVRSKDLSAVIPNASGVSVPSIVVTEYIDSDASYDRAQQMLMEAQRIRRRHRTSRTLSGHLHSWQEPSADLYTVLEEGRNHEVAVMSESDDDTVIDESEEEELNSEDEALYAEDDDIDYGWAPSVKQPSPLNKARL